MTDLSQVLVTLDVPGLTRARVVAVGDGSVQVAALGGEPYSCDVLETAVRAPFEKGDVVLAWIPGNQEDRGIVLGRVQTGSFPRSREDVSDELVLEAKHSLTLRVGAGSITIREDGKILIKGKDLVSHAQRLNRIKGGAVQIN